MLYLKALNPDDAAEEYACLMDMPSENGFENDCMGITYEEFVRAAIPQHMDASRGVHLKPNHVPDTYFFLWDDDRAVALFKLRHCLNDFLREGGGHIGYAVRRSCRGKGYGTKGLALAVEKARGIIPEDEVYLSVDKDNPASLKVMLNNGAYIHHEDEREYYTRIRL